MLQKQPIEIGFQQGLDTKTDPFRVTLGKFLRLQNSVFDVGGRLTKRNGYGQLTILPQLPLFITTFNDNLTAIGNTFQAFAQGSNSWVTKGNFYPLSLSTLSLIRSNNNQTQVDAVTSQSNFICTVYTDIGPSSTEYKYAVADSITGQNILPPAIIPSTGSITTAPRVFYLGIYFIIVFTTSNTLQYVAINSLEPTVPTTSTSISTQITPDSRLNWDGAVINNNLYISWNGSDIGGAIRTTFIDSTLTQHNTQVTTGYKASLMSVSIDDSSNTPNIYVSFWDDSDNNGYTEVLSQFLGVVLAPTMIISATPILNITAVANDNLQTVFYELPNNYSYDSSIPTHYIDQVTCTKTGTVGSPSVVVRSLGLASKAFTIEGITYFLGIYDSPFQPSYFLMSSTGQVISRIAYSNAGGYHTTGLSNVAVFGNTAEIGYQFADLIEPVNKSQGFSNPAGVYTQTGLNSVTFTFGTTPVPAEIASTLNLTGGFLWEYDGYIPVEQNFFLWPDSIEATNSATGGGLKSQKYFYQVVYQWMNNQGNLEQSAPSIPLSVDLTNNSDTPITFTSTFAANVSTITVSSVTGLHVGQIITDSTTPTNIQTGTYITAINGSTITLSLPTFAASGSPDTLTTSDTNLVILNIPTLRLTYKLPNPVKIAIFRWSESQQNYYEVTSITHPLINDITVDSLTFTDTLGDGGILGNALIYTTGGVIEDIGAPSFNSLTLFDDRIWGIDAEDPSLLWYSKQVIEATPVEMSDLFTFYVAPTLGSQGSTGPILCLSPMDDKLILFKRNALYYINGTGPDNTGANSQYSQPIFITSSVGSSLQQSIVLIPQGVIFQSDKGIWLLDRGLGTQYIGAPVEQYTLNATVESAVSIPGTNQVRFTLNSGVTLMYDYYFGQWGTFVNVPAISSTLYQNLHTYVDSIGRVFQETPGQYLDGGNPVLQAFSTSWISAAGLQGYQRAYWLFLLGTYLSPHKLNIQIAYDFQPAASQSTIFTPNTFSPAWGVDSPYGNSATWGGASNIEEERVFFNRQKCESFQLIIDELFDPSFGTIAGAGLTLSSLNLTIGVKKSYKTLAANQQTG